MNESQIIAWLKTYVYAAPEVQLEMISGMAQRFGWLQTQVTQIADSLERVMRERDLAQAQVAELKAEHLVQVDEDEDLRCRFDSEGIRLLTMYSGTAFLLHGYAGDIVHLPAGYYIAKVQP